MKLNNWAPLNTIPEEYRSPHKTIVVRSKGDRRLYFLATWYPPTEDPKEKWGWSIGWDYYDDEPGYLYGDESDYEYVLLPEGVLVLQEL